MDILEATAPDKAPTSEDLRNALLNRANDYAEATKLPNGKKLELATISDRAAGDGKFLPDVEAGGNFTVARYQKVMNWFDANWPSAAVAA